MEFLFRKSEDVFWQHLSQKILFFPDLTAYLTGVDLKYLNPVVQKENLTPLSLDRLLEKMEVFYHDHHLPWVWVIKQDFLVKENLKSFHNFGFDQIDESVAMVHLLDGDFKENHQKDFLIQEDKEDLKAWAIPVKAAFRATYKNAKQYLERHQHYANNMGGIKHFVGFYQDNPIASATLTVSPYGARLDDIAVYPTFQGKGYGKKILYHALFQAKSMGSARCFLEASQAGLGLYKKIGFQELFTNKIFG